MIAASNALNIDARVIGRVEAAEKKALVIRYKGEEIVY
jgi:hypothetical protein